MRSGSLFNPFVPTTESSYEIDHFEIVEEEVVEQNATPEVIAAPDQDSQGEKSS
jgi:hypothetical protein